MKLSKLFKKVSVAVSVLMIAGMLAACSSPSGGSSSGSGSGDGNGTGGTPTQQGGTTDNGGSTSQPGGTTGKDGESGKGKNTTTGEYTVKYDGIVIGHYDEEMMQGMPEGAGIINGKEVTMTSDYVDAYLAMGKAMDQKDYVALVFYQGKPVAGLTQADFGSAGSLLTKNTDYQISSDNKVIVLTDSGAQKMGVKGKKDNSSSEESDSDDEEKIVLTYTEGKNISEHRVNAKAFEAWAKYHGLSEGTDYVLDATGKKGTLTKSGYEKLEG